MHFSEGAFFRLVWFFGVSPKEQLAVLSVSQKERKEAKDGNAVFLRVWGAYVADPMSANPEISLANPSDIPMRSIRRIPWWKAGL
ncbi:MAG: hypothetical protein ACP5MD_09835 [Verrucomicrobiia bacterium]